jgi:hypothetical protein
MPSIPNVTFPTSNLDFINIMSYDYHGTWETRTGHVSPLYASPVDADKGLNVVRSFSPCSPKSLVVFHCSNRPSTTGCSAAPTAASWCWACPCTAAPSSWHSLATTTLVQLLPVLELLVSTRRRLESSCTARQAPKHPFLWCL